MRDKVKEGYEKGDYEGANRGGDRDMREKEKEFFQRVFDRIPEDGKFLDLGCGTGLPFDRYIVSNGYRVTGVDIAEKHINSARKNVPEGSFIQGDFFEQDFEENSFDAVVSFYAIFHIPREEHRRLFEKIRYWLEDDGVILVTIGSEEMDRHEGEIEGAEMVWSSYSPDKSKKIIRESGFNILKSYYEDWREEQHLWMLAEAE